LLEQKKERYRFYRAERASMIEKALIVEDLLVSERIDRYLARKLVRHFTRSQLKKIIDGGGVQVLGKNVTAHYSVKPGDKIEISWEEKSDDQTLPQDIPLNIIHEDSELIILNKPADLVVHPGNGNPEGTLVNALLFHIKKLSSVGGPIRPGIVHRLDKDTSGIMMVAKNDKAHAFLADQFKEQTVERIYRVIVRGNVQHDEGFCEEPVGPAFLNRKKIIIKPSGGKEALTYFKVLERFRDATLLELSLHTGRTHQIRVHMNYLGHPVVGDAIYGVPSPWIKRQCVHAFSLGFIHPKSGKIVRFECPLPEDIENVLKHLRAGE
jgi:23S rRNA pseudouridine1911/1915/1917 synthase